MASRFCQSKKIIVLPSCDLANCFAVVWRIKLQHVLCELSKNLSCGVVSKAAASKTHARDLDPVRKHYFSDAGEIAKQLATNCKTISQKPCNLIRQSTAVCTGNTLNDPPYTASQSNTAILKLEAPYFVNPAAAIQFEDVFAENFAIYNGPGSVLPFYDRLIGQSPAGLVCSSTVLYALQVMGELPNAAAIQYPQGCPTPTDAELSPNVP
jgi:hypothetical protein